MIYQRKIEALGGRLDETVSEACQCLLGAPDTIVQSPKYLVNYFLFFEWKSRSYFDFFLPITTYAVRFKF
jgi:hypothetical protein